MKKLVKTVNCRRMSLFEVFCEKLKPFEEWTFDDKVCAIGNKVYSTGKIEGVKPYSVMTLTEIRFSNDGTEYILRHGNNVYHLRNANNLYRYKGQDLKKQRIYDIFVLALELAVMAITGALSYYLNVFLCE